MGNSLLATCQIMHHFGIPNLASLSCRVANLNEAPILSFSKNGRDNWAVVRRVCVLPRCFVLYAALSHLTSGIMAQSDSQANDQNMLLTFLSTSCLFDFMEILQQ